MRFLWPDLLWLHALLPVLVAAYWWALRRRHRAAVEFSSLRLVRAALGPGQRIRRHIPPLLCLLALATGVVAVARPNASLSLPAEFMTIILAIDVSRSMRATDVKPSRIEAAQAAVKTMITELPHKLRLGIVTFAGSANVAQPPTDNRMDLAAAVDRFQLQRATATGSGLLVALSLLFPDDGFDLEAAVFDGTFSRPSNGKPIDPAKAKEGRRNPKPVPPGSYQPLIWQPSSGR